MNPDQQALWERLARHSPDDPAAAFPFSAKLAKENVWSAAHARRVIKEYKRFAFLALEAGHVAVPSDAVDQAWHLHLTHTRSYWETFCGQVLGRPLHHEPSKGGDTEHDRHLHLYLRTLESYRQFFGEPPPADIWPAPTARFGADARFVRVSRARHWIVPKPKPGRILRWVPLTGLSLALLGCGSATAMAAVFPSGFRELDVLGAYLVFAGVVFGIDLLLRRQNRRSVRPTEEIDPESVDPLAAAMLAGGDTRMAAALLAPLFRHGCVAVTDGSVTTTREPDASSRPAQIAFWRELQRHNPSGMELVEAAARSVLAPLRVTLERQGLLTTPQRHRRARLVSLALTSLVPLVGFFLIWSEAARGRSFGLLVLATVAALVLMVVMLVRATPRTRAGDKILAQLRRRHADLETPSPRLTAAHSDVEFALPMAVALFGLGALANAGLFSLEQTVLRQTGRSDSGGGCGGTGCGGCGGD